MAPIRVDEIMWQAKEDLVKHRDSFKINIDLDANLDDDSRLTIRGDEQLIKTAFSNIIDNGCKYSDDKTTHVFIQASKSGLTVLFKDNGMGISPGEISNIFEPFYRGSNTKNIRGHGIGLSMVKGIIKLHKGTIQLASSPGSGTVVTIQFPIDLQRQASS
jgi:signal transduction histidine kinase